MYGRDYFFFAGVGFCHLGGTNPEFQLTNGLLTGMDYVNGQLGELQQFEVTFQGGTLVINTTP